MVKTAWRFRGRVLRCPRAARYLNGHEIEGPEDDLGPGYGVRVTNHSGVTIRNGSIDPDGIIGTAVSVEGGSDVLIADIDASAYGTPITITGTDGAQVRRSTSDANPSANGIRISNATNTLIADSHFGGSWGGRVEASTGTTITRSSFGGYEGLLILNGGGNRVAGSTLGGSLGRALFVQTSSDNVIRDNQMNAEDSGVIQVNGDRNLVARNTLNADFYGYTALSLLGGDANVVRHNTITNGGAVTDGIDVAAAATNAVIASNAANGFANDGIFAANATARVRDNTTNDNGNLGIEAVAGVRGHGNLASGNGNPAQCTGVVCS
jgi:hypothetical protein